MILFSPAVGDPSVTKVLTFLWIFRFGVLVYGGKWLLPKAGIADTFIHYNAFIPDQIHILVLMVQKEEESKCMKRENSLS